MKEGYKELGMTRAYYVEPERDGSCGWTYLELKNEEDIPSLAEDASGLIQYVLEEEEFLADYPIYLYFYQGEGGDKIIGTLPLGKVEKWYKLENGYYKSPELVAERIAEEYRKGLEWLEKQNEFEEERKTQVEDYTGNKATDTEQDDVMRKENAAKLIYNKVLEGQGYTCMVKYNAKGNLYLDLGDGFTLVYDRVSKNGACELFVLYGEDESSGETTHILEMYAVEIESERVISSGKRAWSDVGSEEYRRATGE